LASMCKAQYLKNKKKKIKWIKEERMKMKMENAKNLRKNWSV
jgi:hypothetical protein